jgi:hypothetical protein
MASPIDVWSLENRLPFIAFFLSLSGMCDCNPDQQVVESGGK